MRITLTMDEEIAAVLMRATEYYGRIFCRQYDVMPDEMARIKRSHVIEHDGKSAWDKVAPQECEKSRAVEEALFQAFHIQYPELDRYSHWGLGYSRETDISYNIYQAVRYALSWDCHPEGGVGVNFNTPSADDKPIPRVEIDGKMYIQENVNLTDGRADTNDV